ncbi:hypothetical protein M422DRAFT_25246 [Sphaerobolus stellatus SS14]|nr:hypothetical protein M422DRAFT_25246 [Sphaerobolus stellatus SS14]
MSRRSILKPATDSGCSQNRAPKPSHVRFPPASQLAATYYAHPSSYYDRSAIVVAPNECALPRRNCPDRTYVESKGEARLLRHVDSAGQMDEQERYQAEAVARSSSYASTSSSRTDYFSSSFPPPATRVPDLTWSESDDSDGIMSPQAELASSSASSSRTRTAGDALAFLPHALPPAHQRKRSPSPRRKDRTYSTSESDCQSATSRRPRARRISAFAPEVPPDYGCLGGF